MKTILNRLISKLCKFFYVLKNKKKLYLSLWLIIIVFVTKNIFTVFIKNHHLKNKQPKFNHDYQEQSYLLLYLSGGGTVYSDKQDVNSHEGEQPLSQGDFVQMKLRKLTAITYITTFSGLGILQKHINTVNFKLLINELSVIFNVQSFYLGLLECEHLEKFTFHSPMVETDHSITYTASFNDKLYSTQSTKANINELLLGKCESKKILNDKVNSARCFLLKNRRLLQQNLYLSELKHSNIVKLQGVCFRTDDEKKESFIGMTVIKEAGDVADIHNLVNLPWNEKVKICHDLIALAEYLSHSPIGSVRLEEMSPANFVYTNGIIKLSNFDQEISIVEKSCYSSHDCHFEGFSVESKCVSSKCYRYNERKNILGLYKYFIEPLLYFNTPELVKNKLKNTLHNIHTLQYQSLNDLRFDLKSLTVTENKNLNVNPDILNNNVLLPDGMQVDSWEQHEGHIAINEVGVEELLLEDNMEVPQKVDKSNNEQSRYDDTYGYKKIENADFPGRFDYYCPHSKAEWGCVVSMHSLEEAARKCDVDVKCKSFITMPHLRKTGWILAIMKSDNAKPVDHAGTTVYVKVKTDLVNNDLENDENKSKMQTVKLCWKNVIDSQIQERYKKEIEFMNACGWNGIRDSVMREQILEGTIKDATSFKPAKGKLANGGQMLIQIETGLHTLSGIFSAKTGPEEYHLAQLASYHMDRMLGFYKTLPVYLRCLKDQEMIDAGFPIDIGGDKFDNFLTLKTSEKKLFGTITPNILTKVTTEHYITVPRLKSITNAVTPLSNRQEHDLEYLILMWLISLPIPKKGFLSVEGYLLIHTKMEEAFRLNPPDKILEYFYNCQFPNTFIEVATYFQSQNCNFGDQLVANIKESYPDLQNNLFRFGQTLLSDIVTRNANRLLEVVDLCVKKFGDKKIIYKTGLG